MVRNMSPENSNLKLEGARPLSRQERIEQLSQDEQRLELIIRQRDAVNEFFREAGYDSLVGMFVGPDDAIIGIKNRHYGMAPNDWLVVRYASNEGEKNQSEIKAEKQKISSVKKTELGKYPFWPIGVEAVDTLYPEDGEIEAFNIFWMPKPPESDNKPETGNESEAKASNPIVSDFIGREFLPLGEIIDPETERKIEAKIKAKEEADEFDKLVQPLRDEGLGEDVKIREDLGASALSGAALSPASQTR